MCQTDQRTCHRRTSVQLARWLWAPPAPARPPAPACTPSPARTLRSCSAPRSRTTPQYRVIDSLAVLHAVLPTSSPSLPLERGNTDERLGVLGEVHMIPRLAQRNENNYIVYFSRHLGSALPPSLDDWLIVWLNGGWIDFRMFWPLRLIWRTLECTETLCVVAASRCVTRHWALIFNTDEMVFGLLKTIWNFKIRVISWKQLFLQF